jgi:periplasmic divalent cation tolerance protein
MESKLPQFIQVFTTVAKKSDAERIAKVFLDKKLSACTQIIGPIISVYRWKRKVEKSKEWLCVAKTERSEYKKNRKGNQRNSSI